jgi:adenylylsulfate kinase-like enzyme
LGIAGHQPEAGSYTTQVEIQPQGIMNELTIAIRGTAKSGKSTVASVLARTLRELGANVHLAPTDGPVVEDGIARMFDMAPKLHVTIVEERAQ